MFKKRKDRSGAGPTYRAGRLAGLVSLVALLVLSLAATGAARSITGFTKSLAHTGSVAASYSVAGYTGGGGYTTTTSSDYHSTTSTYDTTTTTKETTTSTYDTTTTTHATTTTTKPDRGGEGCTPGYWRQSHHYDSWVGFLPTDDYETVFGVDASFTATLGVAVRLRGGGENALARHAVAALLNSTSGGVDFESTTAEVIGIVQDAYATGEFGDAKDLLADQNEEGCPLN
jgi:hypothetical protein